MMTKVSPTVCLAARRFAPDNAIGKTRLPLSATLTLRRSRVSYNWGWAAQTHQRNCLIASNVTLAYSEKSNPSTGLT